MNDVVPDLLDKTQDQFRKEVSKSSKLKELRKLIDAKTATYEQANEYAIELGEILARSFSTHLSSRTLPDGRMYYNIAERILNPTLRNNYELASSVAREIQESLNEMVGIGLKATSPKVNPDKIKGFIDRLANESSFDEVSWILQEPVINFTHQAVNDVLELNANFQAETGLSPKIKRTLVGGACDWCVNLSGTYVYPDVPDDVYKRHERCRCTVEYIPDGVKKQNVRSKSW